MARRPRSNDFQWLRLKPTSVMSKTVHAPHHAKVATARLSAGSLVMNILLLMLLSAVLKAVSNALNVLACACHSVAAGHDCDCQQGRDDLQVHDRLPNRQPAFTQRANVTREPQGAATDVESKGEEGSSMRRCCTGRSAGDGCVIGRRELRTYPASRRRAALGELYLDDAFR